MCRGWSALLGALVGLGCGRLAFDPLGGQGRDAAQSRLSAGSSHVCAIRDGVLACWGDGSTGAVGGDDFNVQPTPRAVAIDGPVVVSAGDAFTCALGQGRVLCWGDNGAGQLGSELLGVLPTTGSTEPQLVPLPRPAIDVAAGGKHACALLDDGTVWCWGSNAAGQLGRDGTDSVPAPVAGLSGLQGLALGGDTSCVIDRNSAVLCWGANDEGQLGDGSVVSRSQPQPIAGLRAAQVSMGSSHACAVLLTNELTCWGNNAYGQLGDASTTSQRRPATRVPGSYVMVTVGSARQTCALRTDDSVACWGRNELGVVGDGTLIDRDSPTVVLADAASVTAGYHATCASLRDGSVRCWGWGDMGMIGDGRSAIAKATATGVLATDVAVGSRHTCASDGTSVQCWGNNDRGQLGRAGTASVVPVTASAPWSGGVQSLVAGALHSCVLAGGGVWCWGENANGELGVGDTIPMSATPLPVPLLLSATALAAGGHTSCAVLSDQTVSCWGVGMLGQLGNDSTAMTFTPQVVMTGPATPLTGVTAIGVGDASACALVGSDVYCWGFNNAGQVGIGSLALVIPVATSLGLTNITTLDVGARGACATTGLGAVSCWGVCGGNGENLIQTGTTMWESVPRASSIVGRVAIGSNHACSVDAGTCWGNSYRGKLADGNLLWKIAAPNPIGGLPGLPSKIVSYDDHVCAIANGEIYCWGDNADGQLGNGVATRVLVPVPVAP